ncbi:PIG-L family deacetylase [Sandaracinomonas limnophila]|uniref:PIG-L family deacetylase n=1 Tax=Sandaracinomonas limnophila TaxID=1862386 RepID=A0A437PWD7_9BACT|nr:PIG-L family deacetylase [Sandaracinomonas limnophila]RVU26560.1 PIG-L family deacetylase [Sandaracinomonas limnophila]
MKKIILAFTVLWAHSAYSQQANSSQLFEDLKAINTLGTVLHVAAHPDDESTNMLTWFARDQHWETNYFSCTRGDGGQNLIGDEQGIALGLIRTQELLAARRLDGANQFFSQAIDFGFSKSTDEALRIWNKELILSNLVYVIRKTRPDIIFTRFPPDSRAGHGQHSASAVLAIEAFSAAADPNRFPEQLKNGITTWQAKRLLWNTFRFGGTVTTSEDQFKVPIGFYQPALGMSTGELAALSRSQHKSQGFGVAQERGNAVEYFQTLKGDAPKDKIYDGIDISWNRVDNGKMIESKLQEIISSFKFDHPEASIQQMVELRKLVKSNTNDFWKKKKIQQIDEWIQNAGVIYFGSSTNNGDIALGDRFKVKTELIIRSNIPVQNLQLKIADKDTILNQLKPYQKLIWNQSIKAGNSITQAYWLEKPRSVGYFGNEHPEKVGQADVDAAMKVQLSFDLLGEHFEFAKGIKEQTIDPVKGEILQPIHFTPKTSISLSPNVIMIPEGSKTSKNVEVSIQTLGAIQINGIEIVDRKNTVLYSDYNERNLQKGDKIKVNLNIKESSLGSAEKQTMGLKVRFINKNTSWTDSLEQHTIAYDHIPEQNYFTPANLEIIHTKIAKTGKLIGYIKGAGDKVPEAIKELGYQIVFLNESDLTFDNLKRFDAVVTGVRAYNTLDYLGNNVYRELMKYIKNGGNYVVQYNTASNLGPLKADMSPYPLTVTRNRITLEDAKPTFALPNHEVLNFPNKITEKDFDLWVQERSIYNAVSDSDKVEFPLVFNDPNESNDKGNIAVMKYGKGRFIYTGIVFFRELPAAVPGAYRLFANLLSNPNSK